MSNLSDIEIREILKRHGENIGPITATTRKIYLKKIESIQKANVMCIMLIFNKFIYLIIE